MSFQLQGDAPEIYERVLVPLCFGRWAEALFEPVPPKPGDVVLDVACGTGVTARLAKLRVGTDGHVDTLDVNAPMLARAEALAVDRNITWIESDVCSSDLPFGRYNLIISQHGYHYFPDQQKALK